MRTTIFAWVALPMILLGLSVGSVAQAEGPLKIHPKNPRYVADHDGNAIFLTGSHTWAAFQERGVEGETPDFDYEEYLEFQKHKTSKTMGEPKKRTVPLIPDALTIIDRQLARHPRGKRVFLNEAGTPYTAHGIRRRLNRWCKRVGIASRPPYALRHTFGSLEAEANVNQAVIGQVMGHTLLQTTTRYIANNYEHHKSAVGAISGRITSALHKPQS